MKKILAVLVAVLFIAGIAAPSFAQATHSKKAGKATEVIHGIVGNIDAGKKEIVVKDEKTGQDRTFTVSEKAVSTLKVGDRVKVKVKEGSSIAESVKVVKLEEKNKK